MTFASRYPADRAPMGGVTICIALAATIAFALLAGRAEAARSSASAGTTAADLCGAAHSVASDIVRSTSISAASLTSANLKTTYLKIQAAEPALLSAANGSQKANLTQVFGFLNVLIADLKKANWNVAGLAPQLPTLEAKAVQIQKPLKALNLYFTNTCKLKT